jgi:SNF2 family DNA or RNA helicase
VPVAELNITQTHIEITDIAYRDRDALQELPGYSYKNRITRCPVSWTALKILIDLFKDRLEIGDQLQNWAWREHAERIGPAIESHDWAMDPGNDAEGNELLYPYQRTGVMFLEDAQSAILTDEMGTGKTAQAIDFLEQCNAYPALVVCPKSAKTGWRREFRKWAPHRDVCLVDGTATVRRKLLVEDHEVFVVTWEALRYHSRLAPYGSTRLTKDEKTPKELNHEWGAVIADEAHRGLDPKAKQTRALWAVGATSRQRVAMTGTPVANTPADFWSLLRFVAPEEWPSRTKYIDRYCLTMYNAFGGLDVTGLNPFHMNEFHKLVKPRHLRRPKDLVLPWLPTKTYEVRDIEMSRSQAKIYNALADDVIADVKGGLVMGLNPLTLLTRLTQAACATLTIDADGKVHLDNPSSKVEALVELLADMGKEPLVVFAHSRQLIELAAHRLDKEGVTYSKIVGGQSDIARSSEEDAFSNGDNRVILLTLGAGSEALTLTRASTTCFMQRSWSMLQNRQAEDRTHRPGQTADKVLIIDLVTPGTVEEDQWDALTGKGDMMQEIVQDREAMLHAIRRKR